MLSTIYRTIGLARIVALALVGFAIAVRIIDPTPLEIVRNLTFDTFQRVQPRPAQTFPVRIVDIDDASLVELGQWPWPRYRFAQLVDNATAAGAVAIAFDIIFAEPDRLSPTRYVEEYPTLNPAASEGLIDLQDNDTVLAAAFSRSRVVVGQTSIRRALPTTLQNVAVPTVSHAVVGPDPQAHIIKFPELVQNIPILEEAAAGRGVFSVRPDPDGVYRRVPLVVSADGYLRMGLAPELLRIATGGRPFAIRTNEAGIDGVVVAGKIIKSAGNGTVRPYLNPSDPARFVSAADLIHGRVPAELLSGHLLLVGTSAIGLEDYRATPLGVQMPGVEIHAQLLENMLSDTLLQRPNYAAAVELFVALIICLVIIVLTPIMNANFLIASSLIFLTSIGWTSFWVFKNHLLLVDPSFPILAGLASVIFMSTANYLREERRRRQIRSAFGHYVSADLVNSLSESGEQLQLGGEVRDLTLIFTDVRGFTTIAEGYRDNPEGLTLLMNRLLNLLSDAIHEEKGTIDKFIGDAVMAFWNAPLIHDDHERAACRAALQMERGMAQLNEARRSEARSKGVEYQELNIGIGVNTGSCMVGNMGSDTRFDYTAMGDPVNLASRLEGLSRLYEMSIVVGSATEAAVKDDFALLELDLIRVKGKLQPERVFTLLGAAQTRADRKFGEVRDLNDRMLKAYRARRWDEAEALLEDLSRSVADLDTRLTVHVGMYRDRIAQMRADPPAEDWNGVFDATSK